MKLSQNQQEKLTLAIQAVLGILVIALSVWNSSKTQSSQMKKLAKKNAKQMARLNKTTYKMKNQLVKQKYRTKLQAAKSSGKK